MKIAFLVSGGGGNLKFVHEALMQRLIKSIKLSVIGDRECEALRFAREKCLPTYQLEYSPSNSADLRKTLNDIDPDIVVTTWHKIIDSDTVNAFKGKMINLHYSLLPAFASLIGVEPIEQAYQKGCKFIGPTCHYVDEGVDTGQIIAQAIFKTNISYEEAVSMMFQTGCITLLNGITQIAREDILDDKIKEKHKNNDIYYPVLKFKLSDFDIDFWNRLKAQ